MIRPTLSVNDHAHIYNRGVDKRIVFNENADYARFVHTLYICNDTEFTVKNLNRMIENVQNPILHIGERTGERFVDILCFTLMPNHFHLLLRQNIDKGISKFMHKIGIAYTLYFNLKNERTGSLFEGKYKYKIVNNEQYLVYLSQYIHLNPIKIIEPKWKEKGITNWKQANDFLEMYKWSSYQDYIGIKNLPSVINPGLLGEYYEKPEKYKKFVNSYLVEDLDKIINLS
ncbi:transposase [Candidatus Parcubacteria bacterium]|nr:transposase [Patescibacteria group bacterium]MCG2694330.1 transposase [Candidatus Parcubacteria bacterium]